MYYLFYLVGLFILSIVLMTVEISVIPALSVSINFGNIINFLDFFALILVFAFCLLALACTRNMVAIKDAFVFMFQKKNWTAQRLSECLLSIKVATSAALIGGGTSFLAQIINMLKSMDLDGGVSSVGLHASVALLSLVYALVIILILLPIYVSLERSLVLANQGEKSQKISVSTKKKKAG